MTVLVTGGAGFVAANLIPRLLEEGRSVIAIDNLSRGNKANLNAVIANDQFSFVQADLADLDQFRRAVEGACANGPVTEVWHLAANSDIVAGVSDPNVDFRDTLLTTFNSLKVIREHNVKAMYFASSSAIYGDLGDANITEDTGPLLPISNYGATKLASEGLISAAVEAGLEKACLFRFPNVVGCPATHGVILDFIHKLKRDNSSLEVLGDGSQRKSYLHVASLVDAMMYIRQATENGLHYFNIGSEDKGASVKFIAESVVNTIAPGARISYGTESRGWVGDVPKFSYSTKKLKRLGWEPQMSSEDVVVRAIKEIAVQEGML